METERNEHLSPVEGEVTGSLLDHFVRGISSAAAKTADVAFLVEAFLRELGFLPPVGSPCCPSAA